MPDTRTASPMPGATRRLWRNKPRLLALGLLCLTAVAASAMQSTAAAVLQQTLDENWRGSYDILVTQRDKDPVTDRMLRSDSIIDASIGRLSMADLALIRALPGVEVAAPIALVSFAHSDLLGDPFLWMPIPVRPDASLENPQAFRISVTSSTDDGIGPRTISDRTVLAFAYQPSFSEIVFDSNGAPLIGPDGEIVYATEELADSPRLLSGDASVLFTAGRYDPETGTIPLGLVLAPRPAANIALVDPVAERELLGQAGSFLDPLIEYQPGAGTAAEPIVTAQREPAKVLVEVKVEEFEDVLPGAAGAEAVEQAQGTGFLQNGQIAPTLPDDPSTTMLGQYDADVSSRISPYSAEVVRLGGIEQELVDETVRDTLENRAPAPRSVLGGRYLAPEATGDGDSIRLLPRGYAGFGLFADAPLSGPAPEGTVTEYSKLFGSVAGTYTPRDGTLASRFEVVGQYSPEDIRRLAGETSFMPLGVYDIANPALVADPTGESVQSRPLATSITGFGIPGTNDVAVGSIDMLEAWNVERPIAATRIRVAGIGDYTPQAQRKLLDAVAGLSGLGFTATIVAGSSPEAVPVLLDGYALAETDDAGKHPIGPLGYIEQDWSRLGAVVEAEAAVSATSIALLVVSTMGVGILLAVVQLGSIPGRRAQSAVLRQLGWQRGRIAGRFAAEELVGIGALAVIGALAIALSSVQSIAALSVGLALALVATTSIAAVIAGARATRSTLTRQRPRPRTRRPGVGGPVAFGGRAARANLLHSISLGLALLLIAASIAIAVTLFVEGRELAGPSLLGGVAAARAWVPQGVLAAVSLTAGITLAVLSRRMAQERRRTQWSAIRAMGWSRRDVLGAHLAELAFSALPGLVLGVAVSVTVTASQYPPAIAAVLVASSLGGLLAVVVVLFSGRRLE